MRFFFCDVLILLQTSSGLLDKVFLAHTFLYRVLVPLGLVQWASRYPVTFASSVLLTKE